MIVLNLLSIPIYSALNVIYIFNPAPGCKRNHGQRHFRSPILHDASMNNPLPFIQKPLGMHHIPTKLFSLQHPRTRVGKTPKSNQYMLRAIVVDIVPYRLYKPVHIKKDNKNVDIKFSAHDAFLE